MPKRYYLKVSLLEREDGQSVEEARPIAQHTAVMGTDKEQVEKFYSLLSRTMGAIQAVFEVHKD